MTTNNNNTPDEDDLDYIDFDDDYDDIDVLNVDLYVFVYDLIHDLSMLNRLYVDLRIDFQ